MNEDEIKNGKELPQGESLNSSWKGLREIPEMEVSGQGRWFKFRCWHCRAVSDTYSEWKGYICWNCGAQNIH